MGRLLYFFPENDIALGHFNNGFTAPAAAERLRLSGEALPLWYGASDDRVLMSGINARWYDRMVSDFGITADIFSFDMNGLIPEPWGWSPVVRHIYAEQGMDLSLMPDDSTLTRIRTLSSRATSAAIAECLAAQLPFIQSTSATEITDAALLPAYMKETGECVLKQPWSSSGRGVIDSVGMDISTFERHAAGIIRHQGSVIVERLLPRKEDFAMLFRQENGRCSYRGLSLFETDRRHSYTGNIVARQEILRNMLNEYLTDSEINRLTTTLENILTQTIGNAYTGPLGIDLMVLDTEGERHIAMSEMNMRNSMGHLCMSLGERFLAPGKKAMFRIEPSVSGQPSGKYHAEEQRLVDGTLDLVPERFYRFSITTQN